MKQRGFKNQGFGGLGVLFFKKNTFVASFLTGASLMLCPGYTTFGKVSSSTLKEAQ